MATSDATLPPMGEISIIIIWAETVLYGVNCVMYGLSMFILLRGGKIAPVRWVLVVMSTILFLLCTVHVGVSLRQLLEAFVYAPADVPNYSTMYWLDYTNKLSVLKDNLYDTLVLAQYSILIWRLYVVFMGDWRVVVLPIILGVGCVATIYAVSALSAAPSVSLYNSILSSLIEAALAFDMILNVSVTVAIAARLWWMGRKMNSLTAIRVNQHTSSIYLVVESGAIFVATNILMLVLYTSNSPASLTILDVSSQLAALTPLLIIVQVGLTGRYHSPSGGFSNTVLLSQNKIIFRTGALQEQDFRQDVPHRTYSLAEPPCLNV